LSRASHPDCRATGRSSIWDVGAIASGDNPQKLERIRNVILASIAVPLVFPSVEFKDEKNNFKSRHVDGSVSGPFFYGSLLVDTFNTRLSNVYLVFNDSISHVYAASNVVLFPWDVLINVIQIMYEAEKRKTIDLLLALYRLNDFDVFVTFLPEDLAHKHGFVGFVGFVGFDESEASHLYQSARQAVEEGKAWFPLPKDGVPGYWSRTWHDPRTTKAAAGATPE
jgi:hypothetical protein